MTIKEIAKMSNVSISTVSKILNGKDQSIGSDTREKVLRIAREYHYAPYENAAVSSRFLIGVIISDTRQGELLLSGINRAAQRQGYGILCFTYTQEAESEKKAVVAICAQNVGVVIWQREKAGSMAFLPMLERKGIETFFCDFLTEEEGRDRQFTLDYGRFGYEAALYLVRRNHRKLGCCVRKRNEQIQRFIKGFRRCLYDHKLENRSDFIMEYQERESFGNLMMYGITGVVCWEEQIAAGLMREAAESGYRVPGDISLLTISDTKQVSLCYPALTGIYLPVEQLGEHACLDIIAKLEKKEGPGRAEEIEVLEGGSAGTVPDRCKKKVVVVGSLNLDSVIHVRQFPDAGQTCVAEGLSSFAGGKGFNQAVGAAKLGADVKLIGKIGQDYEAKVLRNAMAGYGLSAEGISESKVGGTGKAYITVQKNGESNIIVYGGANRYLSRGDLDKSRHLFADADFCLLQLETSPDLVEYAAGIAREEGSRVILKPAAVDSISALLLSKVDIFVPNRKELERLCQNGDTLEEKAAFFLQKGVGDVIVTLDEHGCFWKNRDRTLYFAAAEFTAVDTTGAADAFISALAVYLAEGAAMEEAIRYATYAAGFSITRDGVPTAMVDRDTMEAYAERIPDQIAVREDRMF